ncbi:MAG TPA: sulfatase [Candidatus Hydrogenedentes bacterium]|nr:sulfatase [Candidatus Hydrogenedentota bacterium]HPG65653.1 sulfatase [Candidatus Hydrogenedentota bacterium]
MALSNRNLYLAALAAFVTLVVLMGVSARHPNPAPAPAGPNVIFIVVDALRADRVSAERNGELVMPNLNARMERGLRFTGAMTPCTWTKPAMASIFTSMYVDTHQVFYAVDPEQPDAPTADVLPEAIETMASYLKSAGYATAGIQANGNLVAQTGFGQGFDEYAFQHDARADWMTEQGIARIRRLPRPFFLYLHYMEPHAPYDPPEPYRSAFGPLPKLAPDEQKVLDNSIDYLLDRVYSVFGMRDVRHWPELSAQGKEAVRILYDAECRFADTELARLFDCIDREAGDTVIVFLADHGEEFWEHGGMGHGTSMYDEQLSVPLFLQGPGIAPAAVDRRVSTIDVLPTVAGRLGLRPREAWQGHDLLDAGRAVEPLFSATYSTFPRFRLHTDTVVDGDTQLVRKYIENQYELYDLAADPHEVHNLARDNQGDVRRLDKLLDAHRIANVRHRNQCGLKGSADIPRSLLEELQRLGFEITDAGPRPKVELDPETIEHLKSLGYLQ